MQSGDSMITLRKAADRGSADHGWLETRHSFSFADYHDPAHMGFGNLRVINEDRIAPGTGFGTHGHRDMEILSVVLDGALAHRDSMGNSSTILPGEVQRMSAGRGVMHSEFNGARDQKTHFLQIWILPSQLGIAPGYEQKAFAEADKRGRLRLVASPDGRDESLSMHADASVYAGLFDGDENALLPLAEGRLGYVHLARGSLRVNGQALEAGDGALLRGEPRVELAHGRSAEVLVFDLAP
ncbi:MAG: Quercetin 2,3-dioxygenase [Burkholderiaceae bacterium]|nr:Quercetin 2,3-dioxygenase [Burkholderiaceae bacterium]